MWNVLECWVPDLENQESQCDGQFVLGRALSSLLISIEVNFTSLAPIALAICYTYQGFIQVFYISGGKL